MPPGPEAQRPTLGPRELRPPAVSERRPWIAVAIGLFGLALGLWLARVYFLHDAHQGHLNHEHDRYALRVLEFRDLLGAGYFSPQWASHFRRGLGSPYFAYYQSGFFYAASLVPWALAPTRALGVAVLLYALLGYASMFSLVGRYFGRLSGWLAASLFSLSVYAATEIYVRGDLSEFAAMMLVPANLATLAAWLDRGRARALAGLALAAAALIVTHPAVALVALPLIGSTALVASLAASTRRRGVQALLALAAGVGLAAWYWLPVFLEWDLVSPQAAFADFYHYSEHFVAPAALLAPYTRDTIVPFTLGPVLPAALALSLFGAALGWRRTTPAQRGALLLGVAALSLVVLLMTRAARPAWAEFDLLQRLQFPWRLLSLVTVFAAGLAGAWLPWRSERARLALALVAVGLSAALSPRYTSYALDPEGIAARNVRQLGRLYFAPDIADEWMPVGATKGKLSAELAATGAAKVRSVATPPPAGFEASVTGVERLQGRIRARVETTHAAHVLLPHYFFPVGWQARLDGQPVPLESGRGGLMQVTLPARSAGQLEVRFTHTPMRARGLLVSAFSLVAGLAALHRLRRPGAMHGAVEQPGLRHRQG